VGILILVYHGIADASVGSGNLHCVSARSFREQIDYLGQASYSVVPCAEIASGAAKGAHSFRVGLTFDDANISDIDSAEILSCAGYTALFFIPTDYLGKNCRLGRGEVLELHQRGMGIGSHSHRHVKLVQLNDIELENELEKSKGILEEIVQAPIEHLSFPGGSYDARVLDIGRKVGYRYFYTSDWGINTRRQFSTGVMRRVPILSGLKVEKFRDILELRNYHLKRVQFYSKEMAKKTLGAEGYLKLRSVFIDRFR